MWSSGGAGALGFFWFPRLPLRAQATLTCLCSAAGILSYFAAVLVHTRAQFSAKKVGA
jgi:hypothetical protein